MMIEKHIKILGKAAKDKVTGIAGIVTSIGFDLYGCIQVVLTPKVDKKGAKVNNERWFDITRIQITNNVPVMQLPNFNKGYVAEGRKGPAEKPLP